MALEPGGIGASVRRKLAEGLSRDEIVAGLVAGGLSRPSAERFVDREISAQLPPLEPLIPAVTPDTPLEDSVQQEAEPDVEPAGTMHEGPGTMYNGPPPGGPDQIDQFLAKAQDTTAEDDAKRDLRFGSYVTTVGIALTLISMLFPGRGVLFYGAVLYGVFRFIRGLVRYSKLDVPFPWARIAALAAIPILSFPVLFVAVGVFAMQTGMSADRERFEDDQLDVPMEIRRKAGDAYERRQRRNAENVDVIAENLYKTGWHCDAAEQLARTESEKAVPHLIRFLQVTTRASPQDQICVVNALVELGEIAPAIGYYKAWAEGTNRYLARSGIEGLGNIGPDAAREALPVLRPLVESDAVVDRLLAAQTLGKLGPEAEELLQMLVEDPEESVWRQARQSLRKIIADQQ